MGRFVVDMQLSNNQDVQLAARGLLPPDQIRQVKLQGVVDTGSNHLVLPPAVVQQLGLPSTRGALVRFADGRLEPRDVVEQAHVELSGRHADFNAIVEPGRDNALIGAIVLETLDFLVDCTSQTLIPRDPDRIIAEVEQVTRETQLPRWDSPGC